MPARRFRARVTEAQRELRSAEVDQLIKLALEHGGKRAMPMQGEEFNCSDGHPESPGRLNAFLVPAKALGRADDASAKAALKRTKECRIEELEKLREKKNPTARDGRIHALLAQQLANIVLLEEH